MTALHVVVHPRSQPSSDSALGPLHGVLDVMLDGVNLTARIGPGQALDFLVELSFAVVAAASSSRHRATVALHATGELWELGLEADGDRLLLSVFSPGPLPLVVAHKRPLALGQLRLALLEAIDNATRESGSSSPSLRMGLRSAREALSGLPAVLVAPRLVRRSIAAQHQVGLLALRAAFDLDVPPVAPASKSSAQLERADLLSLLGEGQLSLGQLPRSQRSEPRRPLLSGASQVFLDSERLLGLAECAVESWQSARPTFRRAALTSARVNLRRGPGEAELELTFSDSKTRSSEQRLQRVGCEEFVRLCAGFAHQLAHELRRADPEQSRNLRLRNLELRAERLLASIDGNPEEESVTNPSPDSYRRFVPRLKRSVGIWETGPKMRFMPRWVASVPHIDLRATFLCGDHLMVGGAQETACLRRNTGEVLWKRATRPAACVVTPSGLVRIEADGQLRCHQLEDGEVRFNMSVTPRSTGSVAGSVFYGSGLPRLLALVEGDRHVTAIDLVTGAVRWRHTTKRPGSYRLRRAGRLLVVSGGDPLMRALDGVNGDVVWSLRARLPFSGEIALGHDAAFTLSGVAGGRHHLHCFDPWSGRALWERELDERPLPSRPPLLTPKAVLVPTLEQEGSGVLAYDRQTGEKLWDHPPGLVNSTSAWLAVDDCLVVNSQSGMLLGLGADDGRTRFQHVFSNTSAADQPRRLEPVLRSGALFVPQEQVHVVRPRDGELLGTLPSDLIPDLIRVDERCDVYVAEESGHLAAFGAAPRLSLVR